MSAPCVAAEEDEHRWIQAVEWHALRCAETDLTAAQRAGWRAWSREAENRRIYSACARLHADAQRFDSSHRIVRRLAWRRREPLSGRRRRTSRRVVVGAMWAAAVAGGILLIVSGGPPALPVRDGPGLAQRFTDRTGAGQTRRIVLRDGSTVILGAATVLEVSLTRQRRAVNLERGEAWFHVVHRIHWPFVVKAGNGTITDLGTAFVVDRESGRVEVTVTQGRVEVALNRATRELALTPMRLRPIRLHRGERLTYGQDARHLVRTVNPRVALAWTRGELEFSDEPLRAVIQNVDRYTQRHIEVSPAAGRLRLTTLVLSHRIPGWLEGLSRVLPVTIVEGSAAVCVRLRTHQATHLSNTCSDR